jgi:broad specificity phosphatase PhoE
MARLLLIRHSQTKLHQVSRFWGSTDVELSDTGIKQAGQLRDRLAGFKIDLFYASPLARTMKTAEIIAASHKAKILPIPDLRECSFGYAEGLTFEEISQKFPVLAQNLINRKSVAFPGGESLEQLNERVLAFLESLKELPPEVTVAIVSHNGPLRLMVCDLLGLEIEHWYQMRVDLASLSIVDIYTRGAILDLLNDRSHLNT